MIWKSAKLPFSEQERRDKELIQRRQVYVGTILSTNLQNIATRARQAEGTIKVVISSNTSVNDDTRRKTTLELHEIIENWEVMSAVPADLLRRLLEFRRQISDHNFDMARAGGAFGADNFRHSILERVSQIQRNAAALSGQFSMLATRAENQTSDV